MQSLHVKKNDEVVVLSGADKGKRGRIISVNSKTQRVIVEGVRMTKKHMRKSQQHPNGQIVEREGSVHASNLMKVEAFDARKGRPAAPEAKP